MTAAERTERTHAADRLCVAAFEACGAPEAGVALVAVGGYGRGELAPFSDLDVVLVHDDDVEPGALAQDVWYPLWDGGARLDHSVRSLSGMVDAAKGDLKVSLGLLDVRHVAGDPNLTLRLRTTLLSTWRRDARERLPELRAMVRRRHELVGELAHASVPDVKEAEGGLRDATVLGAVVATWLVDVSQPDLERCRQTLLDFRDVLHDHAGRATDRVAPEAWAPLATALDLPDAEAAQRHLRELGRRISHLSRLAWRRVDAVLARPASPRTARRPALEPVARGVAVSRGEVVLDGRVAPGQDPSLLLVAAAEAAERNLVLAPATAARLVRESAPLPDPWPEGARRAMVRLLAAGRGLLDVWETLEETGALPLVLPEWERIRLLPHASTIHRFTVDRHVVETCVEASALIRGVDRPDVLLVAALLHDIGKGGLVEHSLAGEPIARAVATRMGFDDEAVDLVARLVRRHLLLPGVATGRDLEDPATAAAVADEIGSVQALDLLAALTEADALATSPQAWSRWRAGLVRQLVEQVRRTLEARAAGRPAELAATPPVDVPRRVRRGRDGLAVSVERLDGGSQVTVVAPDRVGLLADVAGTFALLRLRVNGARAWTQEEPGGEEWAVSAWDVAEPDLDPGLLRERLDAVVEGRSDPARRLRGRTDAGLAPTVVVRPEASRRATVLEVRAGDRIGVLYLTCRALADLGMSVRSAHVDTLGPQAVDVFYVQEHAAGALAEARAAEAAHAVRAALA